MEAKKQAPKRFSLDEKAAILAELASATVVATAKKHHVSEGSIYQWKSAAGMKGNLNGGGKAHAKNGKGKAAKASKAKARLTNGHGKPSPAAGLDHLHAQLSTALASVDAMREAFRNVFGGGA